MCQGGYSELAAGACAIKQGIELFLIRKLFAQDVQDIIRKRWLGHTHDMYIVIVSVDSSTPKAARTCNDATSASRFDAPAPIFPL